ncbi:MAG: COX15/CtaA family protein [Pseudomonadota bacterium]
MRAFRVLNLLALILCFIVVVVGAYVRLSHAGLGCPDWPGCYGQLLVPEQAAPGFERPLEAHKAWKEMFHRYIASTLGLLIVALALISKYSSAENLPRKLPWLLVALVIFQGILGMWTVTWQLKPLAVTAHLLGGMTTLALLLWMWLALPKTSETSESEPVPEKQFRSERQVWFELQKEDAPATPAKRPWGLRVLSGLALIALVTQIFLGGWTSSNYAALACPDLPTCHGAWLPDTDVKEAFTLWRGLGTNYEFGVLDSRARVTIHLAHRLGAMAVTLVLLALSLLLWRSGARVIGATMAGVLGVQLTLGLSIVLLQLPLPLAAAHNAGAALLLLTLVAVNHRLWKSQTSS